MLVELTTEADEESTNMAAMTSIATQEYKKKVLPLKNKTGCKKYKIWKPTEIEAKNFTLSCPNIKF